MNQRQRFQCYVVCRDFTKAFDKVWHRGLKFKILLLQLPDIVEKILCSFLDDRTAQVKMEGQLSDKFELKSGVPQGSILSSTLYIFYTSDLRPTRTWSNGHHVCRGLPNNRIYTQIKTDASTQN